MEKKITTHQRNYIIKLIQEDKEIPQEFKYLLFPTKQKEYELVYAGKIIKEDLLANEDGVFPVPLQIDKIFNGKKYRDFQDGWKNMIVFGDNLQFLKTIYENNAYRTICFKPSLTVPFFIIDIIIAVTIETMIKESTKNHIKC